MISNPYVSLVCLCFLIYEINPSALHKMNACRERAREIENERARERERAASIQHAVAAYIYSSIQQIIIIFIAFCFCHEKAAYMVQIGLVLFNGQTIIIIIIIITIITIIVIAIIPNIAIIAIELTGKQKNKFFKPTILIIFAENGRKRRPKYYKSTKHENAFGRSSETNSLRTREW